jgi:Tfp pilus assembly PilM family ATPase
VLVSGGGSRVSGFEAAFQGKTNLPVSRLNPLERMLSSGRVDAGMLEEWGPALAVAVGLAMRRTDAR